MAVDHVRHHSKARLFPVGRLDIESSGLLLLTNDGELSNRITHPKHGIPKKYEVTVTGTIDDAALAKLRKGIYLVDERGPRPTGKRTAGIDVEVIKRDRDRTRLMLNLHEGRNRQVRRMLAALGYPVRKLRRVTLGPLSLKGLRAGEWRDLLPKEIAMLKKAVGLERPAPKSRRR
jgi:pseudouridine synthase